MTTESAPTDPTPIAPKATAKSARSLAWTRRRHSAVRFWREYRTHRAGLVGLSVLVLIGLAAVFARCSSAPTRRA